MRDQPPILTPEVNYVIYRSHWMRRTSGQNTQVNYVICLERAGELCEMKYFNKKG